MAAVGVVVMAAVGVGVMAAVGVVVGVVVVVGVGVEVVVFIKESQTNYCRRGPMSNKSWIEAHEPKS